MRFFFDNCVSIKFVQALSILAQVQGYELVHLTDRFAADTPDEGWIRSLARDGDWVIISGDPRISRGQAQKKTWQESSLTAFFFAEGWASKGFWKQAESLVHWWPQIVLKARESTPGTGYLMPWNGKDFKADLYATMKNAGVTDSHLSFGRSKQMTI